MRQAVFLDRDGVLNASVVKGGKPFPPASIEELVLINGVAETCATLHRAGFLLFCVTNQPDVARGTANRQTVEAMNAVIAGTLGLDEIVACFHDDSDNCPCRKPNPGMLVDLAQRYGVDLSKSVMVGDRWRDIEAGRNAGCHTVLIDYDYNEKRVDADASATSLLAALPSILALLSAEERA